VCVRVRPHSSPWPPVLRLTHEKYALFLSPHGVPEIIQAVLIQAARLRTAGLISSRQLALQLKRLTAEELLPRGLSMVVEKKRAGGARYILKEKGGSGAADFRLLGNH